MKMKKNFIQTLLIGVIMLAGLGLILYPTLSNYWNSFHASVAISDYKQYVSEIDEETYKNLLNQAHEYNESIVANNNSFTLTKEQEEAYQSMLNIDKDGIMGYIQIDKLNIELPIYHGSQENSLQVGAGHLEYTSLPVGGENTHTVIVGHRGLTTAKLFSDLDKMEVGDTFVINVLNETLTYEVDQIKVVLPDDLSALQIEEGKDLCTLVTCTPYGINSHRLLVRGHRIANKTVSQTNKETNPYKTKLLILPMVLLLFIGIVLIIRHRQKK